MQATTMPSAALETFESRSFRFACAIVRLYLAIYQSPGVPNHIARQILAAGTSVGANLAEARAAQSRRDVASKFSIALKEARAHELVAVLTVARRRLTDQRATG
jgi:four helix bundle protein